MSSSQLLLSFGTLLRRATCSKSSLRAKRSGLDWIGKN